MSDLLTREELDKMGQVLEYGSKLQAIKIYREATGHELKEAKKFVDKFAKQLYIRDPERYRRVKGGSSALTLLIVALILAAIAGLASFLVNAG